MNYHSDEWIQEKVNSHYDYVAGLFQEKRVIGAFIEVARIMDLIRKTRMSIQLF